MEHTVAEVESSLAVSAVYWTVPQSTGPATRAWLYGAHLDLAALSQGIANERPVHQVLREIDGATEEEFKH